MGTMVEVHSQNQSRLQRRQRHAGLNRTDDDSNDEAKIAFAAPRQNDAMQHFGLALGL